MNITSPSTSPSLARLKERTVSYIMRKTQNAVMLKVAVDILRVCGT